MSSSEKLIEVKDLCKSFDLFSGAFARKDKNVFAVNTFSFSINRGETYGIVGESGCGKTTTARMLIKMYKATSGSILYYNNDGTVTDISRLNKKQTKIYQETVKYIFQDPAKSLNPRMNILKYSSKKLSKEQILQRAKKAIVDVGLREEDLYKRPAEFSGGQRQRISIARGLVLDPELLICDEIGTKEDIDAMATILSDIFGTRYHFLSFCT